MKVLSKVVAFMSVTNIKIKALNTETGEFLEKLLTLEAGIPGDCLIGRHPSCDVVLDSAEVSRIHGRIWCQDGQCFFKDLGSTNGSQIDDEEVQINQDYLLKQNNLLCIGGFVLTIAQMPDDQNTSQVQPPAEQVALAPSQPRQWSSGELTVRCIQAIAETHDVKTFRFVAEPTVLFSYNTNLLNSCYTSEVIRLVFASFICSKVKANWYKPGQFVTLDLEIEGKRVMRSYSISSTPSRPHTLEITVKRVPPPTDVANAPPGLVSNWLHDQITVGSQVKLTGPMGKFTCVDRQAQKLLFISAGSGITPMISMSRWLYDTGADVDVVFIHSARSPRDLIFRHELESMAARHPKFKLAVTTTRKEPGQAWVGYSGRLNELMLQAIAPDLRSRTVYVCGPNPFMEGVKTILETLDIPMENYHQESFGSPKQKPSVKERLSEAGTRGQENTEKNRLFHSSSSAPEDKEKLASVDETQFQSPILVFTKSGKEIACDSEEIILEVAEQEGLELKCGCRMGACGACKLPLLEGKVNYDRDPECEPGYFLPCIAKPIGRVVIEA